MQSKNKTVVRSMDILTLFLTHSKLSLNEIVQFSGIPKTSVFRMVMSLEEMGLLDKDRGGKYSLGLLFLQFGHLVAERSDIREVALPIMQKLHDKVGEAVNLIVLDGNEAICIEKLDTKQRVRLNTAIGWRMPLYAGACSRVILAFQPKYEQEQYLEQTELKSIASGTITVNERLRTLLEETRKTGFTVSHSELENYISAVAAPIFDHKGYIIAGISVAGLEVNYEKELLPPLVKKVKCAALEISWKFGYTDKHLCLG
ncbi:HTH-type transcriptional regulator KipR [Peribacillus frigoritolerans]|uniref:IclR family transcriptional regulator n=1 Tax=Peribacillus frigoritolerans TaxID=450367 RepID=UPI001D6C63DC|nr:IclR family transcriptional regulator [Peribacillus frigoritolerans]CAH0160569.1 HTH-type transcriptional regulator KipR [Peribacillus frigoritolerans]